MDKIQIDESALAAMRRAIFWENVVSWGHLVARIITFYVFIHFALKYW